jgi:GNAT superfamily N-acetyltransferase
VNARTVELVRTLTVPTLLRVAEERGWWRPDGEGSDRLGLGLGRSGVAAGGPSGDPGGPAGDGSDAAAEATLVAPLTGAMMERLKLAPSVVAPASPVEAHALLSAALRDGAVATGAVSGEWLVGVALAAPTSLDAVYQLAALGVAPAWRRRGLAAAMIAALVGAPALRGCALVALLTAAERDPVDPLPGILRRQVAERLFRRAGMDAIAAPPGITAAYRDACAAAYLPPDVSPGLRDRAEAWLAGR